MWAKRQQPDLNRGPESRRLPALPASAPAATGFRPDAPSVTSIGANPPWEHDQPPRPKRCVTCFDCAAEIEVGLHVQALRCRRCGTLLDFRDYRVFDVESKKLKTKGTFIVEIRGRLYDSDVIAGKAIIKGKFHGKLAAESSLTIYASAEIQGSFAAGGLIIPAQQRFRWKLPIHVGSAELAGELVADLHVTGSVVLRSTARLFGSVTAKELVVEPGAIIVGGVRTGASFSS